MTTIAALTSADFDEWGTLWQSYLTFYKSEVARDVSQATFARMVADRELHGAIARDDEGVAIGFVHWLTHAGTWTTATFCYLEDLFVSPRSRGGGTGRELIEHVRAWAAAAGSDKVYWLTAEDNTTARHLYDKVAEHTGFVHYELPV
ncbi:GNAT family N-acetyltransferase [Microbacterium sp. R86528]|uniref:GNAT family N-acetyltransferase n=1 Tax=Microbacterium sp. R86528 TaxID=3093864 RepID=UPI0037CBEF55